MSHGRTRIPDDLWPVQVLQSRNGGVYEGGAWLAAPCADTFNLADTDAHGGDCDCINFFDSPEAKVIGRGATPDAALEDMLRRVAGVDRQVVGECLGALSGVR